MTEETELVRLHLRAPIEYAEVAPCHFDEPFPAGDESRELIFCFELDRGQASRIDPAPEAFPGAPVFAGRRGGGHSETPAVTLPAGSYAFVQRRRQLDRGECAALAMEQQKDALWERLSLANRLYLRFLFEDGSPVTQLFRPILSP